MTGSLRPDFPSDIDRTFVGIALNAATTAMRESQLLERERVARAAAQASERRIEDLFTQAPAMIAILRGQEHVFEFVNDFYVRGVGRASASDLLGRALRDAVPEVVGTGVAELMDRAYATGEPVAVPDARFEFPMSGGRVVRDAWFKAILQPLRDSGGQVTGVMVHAVETTAEYTARAALEAHAGRIERLQRATAALSSIQAPEKAIETVVATAAVAANAEAAFLAMRDDGAAVVRVVNATGFPAELGLLAGTALSADGPASRAIEGRLPIYLPTAAAIGSAFPAVADAGNFASAASLVVLPLVAAARVVGALGLVFFQPHALDDEERFFFESLASQCAIVVDRVEADEIERQSRAVRDAFIGVVSHELRTPITSILAAADLLRRNDDHEVRREALLADVTDEAGRLHRIVEDLLVLSRVEHQPLEASLEPVLVPRVVRRVVEREARRWPDMKIRIDVPVALPAALAEETYLEQVLRNLVSNAGKYAAGGGEVVVSVALVEDRVRVTIRDSGPGISAADAGRLFDLFFRSPSTAKAAAGSGIGLFVCRSLVRSMGGSIWATAIEPHGSEFGFDLRVASLDEE